MYLPQLQRTIAKRYSCNPNPNRMRLGLLYFATAMSSCSTGAEAWISTHTLPLVQKRSQMPLPSQNSFLRDSSRLHFSSQKDPEEPGILSKFKSLLPKKWFGTEKEQMQIQQQKELKKTVSSGLDEMLKDAPLGFRMMGKMIGPIVSAAASTLGEQLVEQQKTTSTVLEDARFYLESDPAVSELLGSPLQIGAPFSQSSSSTVINGVKQSRVELALPINGSFSSGVARIIATQDGIAQLQVDVGGRLVNVSLREPTTFKTQGMAKSDDIVEAEIIEKDTKY